MSDKIVESVRKKLLRRSEIGIKKYNTTLQENNKDNYLEHIQMELLDVANYAEKLLQRERDVTMIVKNIPNDQMLGEEIRRIYG